MAPAVGPGSPIARRSNCSGPSVESAEISLVSIGNSKLALSWSDCVSTWARPLSAVHY